jgi:DNA replication protein DnaC
MDILKTEFNKLTKTSGKPSPEPKEAGEVLAGFAGRLAGSYPAADEKIKAQEKRAAVKTYCDNQENHSRLICDLGRFQNVSFEDYERTQPNQKRIAAAVEKFSRADFKANPRNLVLFGKVGTGKDHLITAAAKAVSRQGVSVRYFIAERFFADCSDRFKSNQTEKDFLRKYITPDVLIFSDPIKKKWLKESPTDAGHDRFCSVIKQRAQQNRPTWLTGNLFSPDLKTGISQLETIFGSDVVRRITAGAVLCWCDWSCYTRAAEVIQ